ncbi:hypothetical protein L7F22_051447, partial [Adiantum nelumboides]|nr:hypothetical protein [Adiantum nelumboides]
MRWHLFEHRCVLKSTSCGEEVGDGLEGDEACKLGDGGNSNVLLLKSFVEELGEESGRRGKEQLCKGLELGCDRGMDELL